MTLSIIIYSPTFISIVPKNLCIFWNNSYDVLFQCCCSEINHTYSPIHPQNFLEICL